MLLATSENRPEILRASYNVRDSPPQKRLSESRATILLLLRYPAQEETKFVQSSIIQAGFWLHVIILICLDHT